MLQRASTVLGFGLFIVWMIALGNPAGSRWLAWLNALAGLGAFAISFLIEKSSSKKLKLAASLGLTSSLFLFWFLGLIYEATPWLEWMTLAFACLSAVLVILAIREKRPPLAVAQEEFEREQGGRRVS